jgi:hypothetical protein
MNRRRAVSGRLATLLGSAVGYFSSVLLSVILSVIHTSVCRTPRSSGTSWRIEDYTPIVVPQHGVKHQSTATEASTEGSRR